LKAGLADYKSARTMNNVTTAGLQIRQNDGGFAIRLQGGAIRLDVQAD